VFPGFSAGDLSGTRILDHDVREVIDDFATRAEADGIDLTILGSAPPAIALADGVVETE
jgi:hypothetical protein